MKDEDFHSALFNVRFNRNHRTEKMLRKKKKTQVKENGSVKKRKSKTMNKKLKE